MIKKIIYLMLFVFILIAIFLGIKTLQGFKLYKDTMEDVVIEEVIFEIRKNEDYVSIEHISEDFLDILVAVEDHRFYEHDGFDIISFGRAFLRNLNQLEFAAGGSTITQQLAKNLFFSFDKNIERKVAEYIVAKQIEKKYSKDDILEIYVNIIYYGDNYNSIKSASIGYFSVMPDELSYAQSLLLAGIPQAPSLYALSTHFDLALERSNKVIDILVEKKLINIEDVKKIKNDIENLR